MQNLGLSILKLTYLNPINGETDVLNINYPKVDYFSWKNDDDSSNDYKAIKILDKYLKTLDCSIIYSSGRPMMTTYIIYKEFIGKYYRILLKLDNQFIYNEYIDKLINRHVENILFEYNNPITPKAKTKKKNKTNSYRKYKTHNLFTGEVEYVYDNPATNKSVVSSNPNLEESLNKKKTKVDKRKGLDNVTFNFKRK